MKGLSSRTGNRAAEHVADQYSGLLGTFCNLLKNEVINSDCVALNGYMVANNEVHRILNEVIVA
jgi:hypothetical protein